jgi:hypothetical protein
MRRKRPRKTQNARASALAPRAGGAEDEDDDDDDDAHDGHAPAGVNGARKKHGSSGIELAHFPDSSDDDDDGGGAAPAPAAGRVTPAAGAKPLPPPPPPTQLAPRAVEWHGVSARAVGDTKRLFALCCPCLDKSAATEQFEPLR